MRKRGKYNFKRIEVWCKLRSEAVSLMNRLKEAWKKKYHISIRTEWIERQGLKMHKPSTPHDKDRQTLNILQWNARGLKQKMTELKQEMEESKVKIACIQESSLKEDALSAKFYGYTPLNVSRINRRGGGLVTLVHDSLPVV